ncbi:MAG: LysM peptidoglycan-binding domain-containing protein [Crocinitomicaceae bacterium]|nr:LysM peptidoglycan-binding domain-containing protein [Crocinitomicaceae bacterium]
MKRAGFIFFLLKGGMLFGQSDTVISKVGTDSIIRIVERDDRIAQILDSTFLAYYFESNRQLKESSFNDKQIDTAVLADSVIVRRLDLLSEASPIEFTPHKYTIAFARLYAEKKKQLTARMLGASTLYFPVFEEALNRHGLPLELKFLPVIESALNAKARSHMGASGLWQFMPGTAKGRGLKITSYIDERSDLYKATDAACQYLKDAFEIYQDWHLAIASYNAGAGNVNKAIRRSNGKTNFWEIRSYLPKETQSYVPSFLGCAYAMSYYQEHNITPVEPKMKFFELDTLYVNARINIDVLGQYIQISAEDLSFYNPSYTKGIIPKTAESRVLVLPRMSIGVFEKNKDSIYANSKRQSPYNNNNKDRRLTFHVVKSGEYLGVIAKKHQCSISDLKKWNYLKTDRLRTGQKLRVYEIIGKNKATGTKTKKTTTNGSDKEYSYYTIKKGDTLWEIAQRYEGVSMEDLKDANSQWNFHNLKTGTKIKIPR